MFHRFQPLCRGSDLTRGVLKYVWLFGGICFTALAFIGIALPLVPTTPFLLLAAFCFARSSTRLHRWLYDHKWFGRLWNDWEQHGAINRPTKVIALCMLIATPVLTYLLGGKIWVVLCQIPIVTASGAFIMTRPGRPVERPDERSGET